jgi:hypothetical protein
MYSFKIELSRKGFNLSRFLPVHEVIKSDFHGIAYKSLGTSLASQYVPDYFNENEVYETEYEAKMEFNKKMIEVTNQMTQRAQNLLTKIENLKRREYNL